MHRQGQVQMLGLLLQSRQLLRLIAVAAGLEVHSWICCWLRAAKSVMNSSGIDSLATSAVSTAG